MSDREQQLLALLRQFEARQMKADFEKWYADRFRLKRRNRNKRKPEAAK